MRRLAILPNRSRVVTAGLLLVVLLTQGCGSQRSARDGDSLAPGSSAGGLLGPGATSITSDPLRGVGRRYMPLAVGNRWDYVIHLRTRLVSEGVPDAIGETEVPLTSQIVGLQSVNAQDYYLQAEFDPRVVSPPAVPQWGLRQDLSGLYSLDLVTMRPGSATAPANSGELAARCESALAAAAAKSAHPAAFGAAAERLSERLSVMSMPGRGLSGFPRSVRGGAGFRRGRPLPGEISLLVYPLFKSSRWIVRDSPRFARVVVRRETTHVPAGDFSVWVLRGLSELYGPNDVVYFSQAREGVVRITLHAEQEATDIEGNPIGRMIFDMDQSLTALTIAGPTL